MEEGEGSLRGVTAAPPARRPWWVFSAIGAGAFMSAFGGSAVNATLPVIQSSLGSGIATVQWVLTVFLLAVSALLLSFGRLGDILGHRTIYLWGFVGFIAGSTLCAISPSAGALIASRVAQGIGAAMLFANSPAILTGSFRAEDRGRVLGLLSMMTYIGLTAGPSLGGWIAANLGWRAVFYVNVPVGLAALLIAWRVLPRESAQGGEKRFDLMGAGAFTVGLLALLLFLNQGYSRGWDSAPILLLLVASVALLTLFVAVERRDRAPMLDLGLFRSRIFSAAAASAMLNYLAIFICLFLMPFLLIRGMRMSVSEAGLLLTCQPLAMAITAPLSGAVADRVGSRGPSTLGMAILATGLFLLASLDAASSRWEIGAGLAVVGLGTGIFISPNSSALMGAAPKHRQGIAGGVLATARNLGMALGVGLSGAILTTLLARGADLHSAIRAGFLVAGAVALAGVPISASRGGEGSRDAG
ncbi:MAG: MFS transporter [Candidatus Eisenbacteria bacterium]|nr:MFS transporter [Candidatus Eisenbacteria bacterium]